MATKKRPTKRAAKRPARQTTKQTAKGRPAGAKTKDRAVVTTTITRSSCPRCGCTKDTNRRLRRSGQASGTIDGQTYGSYKHFDADCADCGQALTVAEYEIVPDAS